MILYLLIGLLTLAVVGQWVLIYKLEKDSCLVPLPL